MIKQAVILAAGKGSRIRQDAADLPKPLHLVGDTPLIKRTILTLAAAGIEQVTIVVGFMGDVIRRAVQRDPSYRHAGVRVAFVDNPAYDLANGVSVIVGGRAVHGPFVLSMSDHVYDAALPRAVAGADLASADLYLAVDRAIAEVYDPDDATKVRTDGDRIVDIGKTLRTYDAIDCGVFAVTPRLLEELERLRAAHGDCSLSDGVRALAARRRAAVVDIGDAFWQDVDTTEARARAEGELIRRSYGALAAVTQAPAGSGASPAHPGRVRR